MAPQFGVRATGKTAYSKAGNAVSTDATLEDDEGASTWDDAEEDAESADDASEEEEKKEDDATGDSSEDADESTIGAGSTGAAARSGAALEEEDDEAGISSRETLNESFRSRKWARKHDAGMTGGFTIMYPAMDPAVNAARAVNTGPRGICKSRCMCVFISYYYTTNLLIFQ